MSLTSLCSVACSGWYGRVPGAGVGHLDRASQGSMVCTVLMTSSANIADLLDCQRDQLLRAVWPPLLFACGDHGHPRTDPPRRFRHAFAEAPRHADIVPLGCYLSAAGTVGQARMVADDAGKAGLVHCYVPLAAGAAVKAIGHARDRRRPPPGVVAMAARPSDEQVRA